MRITLICAKTTACRGCKSPALAAVLVPTHRLPDPPSPPLAGATLPRLPSLSACSGGADLAPLQRRAVVLAIAALHVVLLWALLQVQAVREQALQIVPILVDLLAPPLPTTAPTPPAPPRPPEPLRQAVVPRQPPPKPRPLPPAPLLASATPAPAETFSVPPAQPAPAAPAPPADPPPVAAAPMPAVLAAPPPKVLPDAAVQYLQPPQVEYPRLSQRRGETGLVLVRAYVGTGGGVPLSVEVERSSGHTRLDQAALAAVHKARFKPYAEAGRPVQGWALIPIRFELEK